MATIFDNADVERYGLIDRDFTPTWTAARVQRTGHVTGHSAILPIGPRRRKFQAIATNTSGLGELQLQGITFGVEDDRGSYDATGLGHSKDFLEKTGSALIHRLTHPSFGEQPGFAYFSAAEGSRAGAYRFIASRVGRFAPYVAFEKPNDPDPYRPNDETGSKFLLIHKDHLPLWHDLQRNNATYAPYKRLDDPRANRSAQEPDDAPRPGFVFARDQEPERYGIMDESWEPTWQQGDAGRDSHVTLWGPTNAMGERQFRAAAMPAFPIAINPDEDRDIFGYTFGFRDMFAEQGQQHDLHGHGNNKEVGIIRKAARALHHFIATQWSRSSPGQTPADIRRGMPSFIHFSAAEPSRADAYRWMARRVSRHLPYVAYEDPDDFDGSADFYLIHDEHAREFDRNKHYTLGDDLRKLDITDDRKSPERHARQDQQRPWYDTDEHRDAAQAFADTTAEDGHLDISEVPREWRDEASQWSAAMTPEALASIKQRAQEMMGDPNLDPEDIHHALRMAAGEHHASDWYAEAQRREDADLDRWSAMQDKINEASRHIGQALGVNFNEAASGSHYADHRGLKLRISDHPQKPGGGFHEGYGQRMGEADLQWVFQHPDDPLPSETELRQSLADALRAKRQDAGGRYSAQDGIILRYKAGAWNPEDHPRDDATGEFVDADEGGGGTAVADEDVDDDALDFDPSSFGNDPATDSKQPKGKRRYNKKISSGGKAVKNDGPVKDRKPSPRGYKLTWVYWENENLHKHAGQMMDEMDVEQSPDVMAAVGRAIDAYDWGTPRSLYMQIQNGVKAHAKDRSIPLAKCIDDAIAKFRKKVGSTVTWTERKAVFAAQVKKAATDYDVPEEEIRDALDFLWEDDNQARHEFRQAWDDMKGHGWTPGKMKKLQAEYGDTAKIPGWDQSSKIIARTYPTLGLAHLVPGTTEVHYGDVSEGLDARLFEIVMAGPDAQHDRFTKTSQFNIDRAAELAAHNRKAYTPSRSAGDDGFKFSRSRETVERFRRWKIARYNHAR